MSTILRVASYNIHKGFSHFNRRMVIHELRERLRALSADIVFLQEVQGSHLGHAERIDNWPTQSQHEFLADSVWGDFAYGKNAVYDEGHHGNAILSRYPILRWENLDISAHTFESRGLLHAEMNVPGMAQELHCICVHLGLFERGRAKQMHQLAERIRSTIPDDAPLIIAGDFNDWRIRAGQQLAHELGLHEVFESAHGSPARSFPSAFPLFHLDRIYARGFEVADAQVLHGAQWRRISDHAVLVTTLVHA
ncbi:MAG: endonuclease/exonuclease/phosphatase family protein [Pseudomonadota bacterium]|uniref:endonuclease/exonuclease/phosphatase family protein n=1 Tax=Sulfuriferula sp. TaxID=2025307 RepID=UPI00272FA6FB|nr:endonuclease/exonuclease/phosphatase family protein [Sulfuriferula sp.]MDP2027693.1 endonuclease/exonuclease/phosphatase family protein [Sulfuriferula sp.]